MRRQVGVADGVLDILPLVVLGLRGFPVDRAESSPKVGRLFAAELKLDLAVELGLDAHDLEFSYQAFPHQLELVRGAGCFQ